MSQNTLVGALIPAIYPTDSSATIAVDAAGDADVVLPITYVGDHGTFAVFIDNLGATALNSCTLYAGPTVAGPWASQDVTLASLGATTTGVVRVTNNAVPYIKVEATTAASSTTVRSYLSLGREG